MLAESHEVYSRGTTKLYCISWQSIDPPKAVILIVHGLGEHVGRYEEVVSTFVKSQLAVFTFDQRGHGQSAGKKGHASSIDQLIEDTEQVLMKCRSQFLDIPIFIFGHSMGGQIVASYLKKMKSNELSGAIISSAWFELASPPPNWQIALIKQLKKIIPGLTLSNKLDPGHISSVAEEVALYQKDPLVHDQISFALFNALYTNGLNLLTEEKKAKIPVLVCHGDEDKITSHPASEKYAWSLGEKATFKTWKGSYHEPHHDKNKKEVVRYYANWVLDNL